MSSHQRDKENKKEDKDLNLDLNNEYKSLELLDSFSSRKEENAKWINNNGEEVEEVFGFNENAELVNGRAAMFGFLMLILTEFIFNGVPASKSIFGIG